MRRGCQGYKALLNSSARLSRAVACRCLRRSRSKRCSVESLFHHLLMQLLRVHSDQAPPSRHSNALLTHPSDGFTAEPRLILQVGTGSKHSSSSPSMLLRLRSDVSAPLKKRWPVVSPAAHDNPRPTADVNKGPGLSAEVSAAAMAPTRSDAMSEAPLGLNTFALRIPDEDFMPKQVQWD